MSPYISPSERGVKTKEEFIKLGYHPELAQLLEDSQCGLLIELDKPRNKTQAVLFKLITKYL